MIKKNICYLLTLIFTLLFNTAFHAQAVDPNRHIPITAFWWNGGWDHYDGAALEHVDELIIFAIAADRDTGALLEHPESTSEERIYIKGKTEKGLTSSMLRQITQDAQKYGTKLTIGMNGMGQKEKYFNDLVRNNKHEIFAANMLAFCKEWGISAIDIDYEHVKNEDDKVFLTAIVTALRDAFHPEGLHVTGAFGASRDTVNEWLTDNHQLLDQINLMSYTQTPSWIEDKYGILFNTYGIPKEKVFLGMGFYGKGKDSENRNWSVDYRNIVKAIDVDNTENTFSYPHPTIANEFIELTYNNSEQYVAEKVNYVRQNNLGGIMVWALNHDVPMDDETYSSRIKYLRAQTNAILSTSHPELEAIDIYPTLVKDIVEVSKMPNGTPYKVVSFSGQEVLSGKLRGTQLNLSNLKKGGYVLLLNNTYHIKIIKQ